MNDQSSGRFFTKVEIKIQNFIEKYGVDELIRWLDEYSTTISQKDYNLFHRIQRFTCEVYNIPIADINGLRTTNNDHSDAKKIISFVTSRNTRLQNKHIAKLQNCTSRTVTNHIADVKDRIHKVPNAYKDFNEKYKRIMNKLDQYYGT